MTHLLEVRNLQTQFILEEGILQAVDGLSYYIDKGEIVAFVGESGSGKSVTQYSGLQLIEMPPGKITGGEVLFEGENILSFDQHGSSIRQIRGGKISVVFQEPMTSLNPVMTVGKQICESIMLHLEMDKRSAQKLALDLMQKVGIPDAERRIDNYPHQFSGGMRQRIMIAMAMSCKPVILIADEATTALDVTTQAQILELLRDIVKQTETSMVMVTHNLGIVARYADRIYVMYAGKVVESGTAKEIFGKPAHPYTIGLLNAIPSLSAEKGKKLEPIEGIMPSGFNKSDICPFLPRCRFYTDLCETSPDPDLRIIDGGNTHATACYLDIDPSVIDRSHKAHLFEARRMKIPQGPVSGDNALLRVEDLKVYFPVTRGFFKRKVGEIRAVDGIGFAIQQGETLGLVGESGCGKSTVARSILGIYKPTAGRILFREHDLSDVSNREMRKIRRNVSMIFQDPFSSLDPRQKAGDIIGEPLRNFKLIDTEVEYRNRIDELFSLVGLDPAFRERFPHEFSGGQRQRIGIARALAADPALIVCDEAISALDVSIQAQIINLLEELQERLDLTYLFIAHDLSVVRHISDRVVVMYLGKIVETAGWEELYNDPLHPYTRALMSSVPVPDPFIEERRKVETVRGEVPSAENRPPGCVFSNRCPLATSECTEVEPPLEETIPGHYAACIHLRM